MTMPNFFVIGAQKAGTTSLYHYLAQHPQIYMSPTKEPCFFNHEIHPDGKVKAQRFNNPGQRANRFDNIEEYRELFRGAKDETVIGEASPPYIYAPGTAERIKRYAPEAKVIAILRDPADRAYSAFLHAVRIGKEPTTDFARALLKEENRVRENWHYTFHYRSRGFYHAQLIRYYEAFQREQIGIWLYEDLRKDPAGLARSIYRFLGLDEGFVPDTSSQHNTAGVPKSGLARATVRTMDTMASAFLGTFTPTSKMYPLLSKMRHGLQSRLVAKPPALDLEIRADLVEGYREDILQLQDLIGRDLSAWLVAGHQTSALR